MIFWGGTDFVSLYNNADAVLYKTKQRKKRIYNFWSIINCMEKGVNRTVIYSLILMLSFAQKRKRKSFPEKGKGL